MTQQAAHDELEEKQTASQPAGTQRTGGRSARVRQAVLDSALIELSEQGYSNFSIATVAKRAQVHETTIYRRWPKREDLIADACMQFGDNHLPVPDTGSLRQDLTLALGNIVALMQTPIGQALIALSFTARQIPEMGTAVAALWHSRMHIGQRIFAQAIARGEWPSSYDQSAVFAELVGPLLARYFLLQQTLSDDMLEERIHAVLAIGKNSG